MKRILTIVTAIALAIGCSGPETGNTALSADDAHSSAPGFTISDGMVEVKVGEDGSLLVLRNKETGHNYAGGSGLWRMFYNTHEEK